MNNLRIKSKCNAESIYPFLETDLEPFLSESSLKDENNHFDEDLFDFFSEKMILPIKNECNTRAIVDYKERGLLFMRPIDLQLLDKLFLLTNDHFITFISRKLIEFFFNKKT